MVINTVLKRTGLGITQSEHVNTFSSEETSHNLSPGRWGRGGSEDFQGITWFSGGTVAADHSSPAEY